MQTQPPLLPGRSNSIAITARKHIPLDPTAEARFIQQQYEQSRRARLQAVRESSKAAAAERRVEFQNEARKRKEQEARAAAELARMEESRLKEEARLKYEQAQREFGEAQRASATLQEQKLVTHAKKEQRRVALDKHAKTRFQSAITLVQSKNQAAQAARMKMIDTRVRIAEKQRENRERVEKQERAFAERAPAHLIGFAKVAGTPTSSASTHSQSPSLHVPIGRSVIPGGLTPQTPTLSSVASTPNVRSLQVHEADVEEEEEPQANQLPLPLPHPHPSTGKKAAQLRSPATVPVKVALSFASPFHPPVIEHEDAPEKADRNPLLANALNVARTTLPRDEEDAKANFVEPLSPTRAAVAEMKNQQKQRAVIAFHRTHLQHQEQARHTLYAGLRSPSKERRAKQHKAFEIVVKEQGSGRIVRQEITPVDSAGVLSEPPKKTAQVHPHRRSRPIGRVRLSTIRSRAKSVIPILTPNAAFFAATTSANNEFEPNVVLGKERKALAWNISCDTIDSTAGSTATTSRSSFEPVLTTRSTHIPTDFSESGILRGWQLAQAHKAAKEAELENGNDEPIENIAAVADDTIEVSLGGRYFSQTSIASEEILLAAMCDIPPAESEVISVATPQVEEPGTSQSNSIPVADISPSIPSPAPASRVLTDQEFLTQAWSRCQASASIAKQVERKKQNAEAAPPSKVIQAAGSPVSDPSGTTPEIDLDRRLNSILQKHLQDDAELTRHTILHAKELLFSPQTRSTRGQQDDSDDDESNSSITSPPSIQTNLSWFNSPSFTSPTSAGPSVSSTPTFSVLSAPTAATDLFIESIHFYIEQERLAAERFEQVVIQSPMSTQTQKLDTIQIEKEGRPSNQQIPLTHHAAFSSPTVIRNTPVYIYAPQPMQSLCHTPSKSTVNGVPSVLTDKKALLNSFAHMSDADFQKNAPVHVLNHTPSVSVSHTPIAIMETPARYAELHAHRSSPTKSHMRMQQQFERRMAM